MKQNDFFLLVILILVAVISWLNNTKDPISVNTKLTIQQNQKIIKEIALKNLTKEETIFLSVHDGQMQIKITKDSAQIISSPCPNKQCVRQGAIFKEGESIVCVPEKVIVSLKGPRKENDLDAILR